MHGMVEKDMQAQVGYVETCRDWPHQRVDADNVKRPLFCLERFQQQYRVVWRYASHVDFNEIVVLKTRPRETHDETILGQQATYQLVGVRIDIARRACAEMATNNSTCGGFLDALS